MSKRTNMLASVIREIIAPVLRECPPACGMTSITEIDVSKDFSYATVYISALEHPERALQYLERRLPKLKSMVGAMHRKKIPELRFRIDPRSERASRLDDLLSAHAEDTDN